MRDKFLLTKTEKEQDILTKSNYFEPEYPDGSTESESIDRISIRHY